MAKLSSADLDEIAEAERTVWEFFLIAHATSLRWNREGTPFTPEMIEKALGGAPLSADDRNPLPRSTQFELYVASLLVLGGVEVRLGEPDLRILYWGEYAGVAAKRMNSASTSKIEERLIEAAEQVGRWVANGYIAINLDVMYRGVELAANGQDREALFRRMTEEVGRVAQVRFGPLKKVRGFLIFGRIDGWDLSGPSPRHNIAYPFARHLFDEEEDRTIRARAEEFWNGVETRMDNALVALRAG